MQKYIYNEWRLWLKRITLENRYDFEVNQKNETEVKTTGIHISVLPNFFPPLFQINSQHEILREIFFRCNK